MSGAGMLWRGCLGLSADRWVLFPSVAALQLLERDAELSVSSLATQTMLILRSLREQPASGWTLWTLCCWPRKARQK